MINVALLGFGVVGSGCAEVLTANKEKIEAHIDRKINIKYILDLREFPDSPFGHLVVHDFNTILNDPEVSVVAEMMGGSHPAYDFTKALLEAGKSVVTSNKEVVSTFGVELLNIAAANNARYLFEASVGGGIPIIRPLTNDLAANEIISIDGILNGTTNFILTKMKNEGSNFEEVLKEAQRLGYAEANPSADVDGVDAARKIAILAALASGKLVDPKKVSAEGIRNVTPSDIEIARKFGYAIKLIGHYETDENGKIVVSVAPRFVSNDSPLSTIDDVFNGILVKGNMLGDSLFYGRGAGKLPTASAVCADIIDAAFTSASHAKKLVWTAAAEDDIADVSSAKVKRCIITEDLVFISDKPLTAAEAAAFEGFIKSYEIV
jgi:homoserine dehydrogenase